MSAEGPTHDPFAQVGPGDDAPSGLGADAGPPERPAAPAPSPSPQLSPAERMAAMIDAQGNTPAEIAAADARNAAAAEEDPASVPGTPEWVAAQQPRTDPPAAAPAPEPAAPRPTTTAELPDGKGPVVPDPPRTETERFDPEPTGPLVLEDGSEVEVVPLKLRETMRLLRIVTHGTGPFLGQLLSELTRLNDGNDEGSEFAQTLLLTVLTSIPDAEQEAIDFVNCMVRPAGWDKLSAPNRSALDQVLQQYMVNPSLEDTIAILERVVRRESEDLRGLGKRIATALTLSRRVTKPETTKNG